MTILISMERPRKRPMNILYLGELRPGSTSLHRMEALRRLGHEVHAFDPRTSYPRGFWALSLGVRTGFRIWQPWIRRAVLGFSLGRSFDTIWVDAGAHISPSVLSQLKESGRRAVAYNHDDPFGGRDGRKWDLFRHSLPIYDLVVVVREENVEEARAQGARRVVRVFRSFDPVAHEPSNRPIPEEFRSKVVFAGDWMPERGPFLVRLLESGVPLTLFGAAWEKAREYPRLSSVLRGDRARGANYTAVIAGAQVALGLLSRGNRDLHTTRSLEIPAIGGAAFCAERTREHEALFTDGVEAALWSDPEECARQCHRLLANPALRVSMASQARERVHELGLGNDDTLAWILDQLKGGDRQARRLLSSTAERRTG